MEMKSKRKVALAVGLLLVVASIAAQICVLTLGPEKSVPVPVHYAKIIVYLAAFIFAGIYIATGFKKSSSLFFKLFIYSFMIALILHIAFFTFKTEHISVFIMLIVMHVVSLGFLIVLAFTKDLGKKKSLFFAYAILVLMTIILACGIVNAMIVSRNPAQAITKIILNNISKLTASAVLVSTVHMKYLDKKSRNTK